jgi:hypothetical protein
MNTTNSFVEQVRVDTASYVAQYSTVKTTEDQEALHDRVYAQSLAFVDSDSAPEGAKKLIDELSMIYLTEPKAQIKTYDGDFVLASDTAVIDGKEFEVTVDGKRKSATPSAPLKLKLTDSGWKIAGFGSE